MNAIETPSTVNGSALLFPGNDDSSRRIYHTIGANSAQSSNATLTAIASGLNQAYSQFQNLEKNLTQQRVTQYQAEVQQLLIDINDINADNIQNKALETLKNNEINAKNQKLIEIQQGIRNVASNNAVPVALGTLILIILTLYLFVFYSAMGYTLFGDNVSKFSMPPFRRLDTGTLAIVILFPVLFLSIGYLIHIFEEKKRIIIGILLGTLILDIILAHQIAHNTHDSLISLGIPQPQWTTFLPFKEGRFYFIIAAGFLAYVAWGLLMNYVIKGWKDMQPDSAQRAAENNLTQDIINLTNEVAKLQGQIGIVDNKIEQLNARKEDLQKKINILRAGGIVIDVAALKGMVGYFMNGWNSYINYKWLLDPDIIQNKISDSNQQSSAWLVEIEKTLN